MGVHHVVDTHSRLLLQRRLRKSPVERVSVHIVAGTNSYRAWHFFK
ncbi:hypothetical protein RHOER0001_0778 [Rhodococcus erythropolis SK121]|nr:hypothetical protein RHOER0001_0778 [Rhodococcus erythropolis SK121]